jgi:hypothetical protein
MQCFPDLLFTAGVGPSEVGCREIEEVGTWWIFPKTGLYFMRIAIIYAHILSYRSLIPTILAEPEE